MYEGNAYDWLEICHDLEGEFHSLSLGCNFLFCTAMPYAREGAGLCIKIAISFFAAEKKGLCQSQGACNYETIIVR